MTTKPKTTCRTVRLGDLAKWHYGFPLVAKERSGGSIPVYGSGGVVGYHDTPMIPPRGIIIGRKGNVGSVYYSPMASYPIDTVYYIDPRDTLEAKACPLFLYYLLKTVPFASIGSDTGVPGLNRDLAYGLEVRVPDDEGTRQQIAEILSAFDEKIENNNRIIKTLEEMAQAIFKEWFTMPAEASAKDAELPKGWKTFELRDVFSFVKGKKPNEISDTPKEGFLPQILIDAFSSGTKIYANTQGMVVASEEDLLMVMDGASSGRIEFGMSGVVGSTISKLILKRPINSILYFFLKSREKSIRENTTGSAIPHTDKEKVYSYRITLPENAEDFESVLHGFIEKIRQSTRENQRLAAMRDLLLPRLMSGEIQV